MLQQSKTMKKKDIAWLNNVRFLATISVIILHVSSIPVLNEFSAISMHDSSMTNWHSGNIFDSLTRFCVPVFVMLSGALLLPNHDTINVFLKKRVKRILLPFIFWSGIYTIFNLSLKILHQEQLDVIIILQLYIHDLFQGASFHLWYVYMVLCLYFFIPVISPWINKATNKELLYFLCIWAAVILYSNQNMIMFNYNFTFPNFAGYIGYLILGYYISHKLVVNKKIKQLAFLCFIAGFTTTVLGTYISSKLIGAFNPKWYNYLTINVALLSTGIFTLLKSTRFVCEYIPFVHFRDLVCKYSYGIYLVHVLVLGLLALMGIDYTFIAPVIGIIVTSVLCLIISLFIIMLLNKIPFTKSLSG